MWQKIKNMYHLFVAVAANIYYMFPGRKLYVIGITGTDGKTTTVNLVYHMLKNAGLSVSMISTVGAVIHGKEYALGFHVTNPSSWDLQKFLKQIVDKKKSSGKNYLVLEVTSHGIDQNRIWGIPFAVGLITNITHEHLDYHQSYKNYVFTKSRLLQSAKIRLVNRDDESYNMIKQNLAGSAGFQTYSFGLDKKADFNPLKVGITFNTKYALNAHNLIAAISIGKILNIQNKILEKSIKTFQLPVGRQEIVYDKNFTIMIDFAHTPNAFEKILSSIKPSIKGELIHVFGAAGLRDKTKRPLMGKISSQYSNIVILTSEDPRTENVQNIMSQVISGMKNSIRQGQRRLLQIPDRQEAINTAVGLAKKGDFILITGKGHETSMNYGKGEVSWSDFESVKKALSLRSEQ